MTEFNIKTKTSGKCRVYPDSPNGLQPSVTSICGALMKYGLIDWAANCAVDYIEKHAPIVWIQSDGFAERTGDFGVNEELMAEARHAHEQIKDEAADFGTLAHLLCQLWLEGKDEEYKRAIQDATPESTKMALPLVQSFSEWAVKNTVEPVHTEIKLHGDGYSCRSDLIAYRTCPKTGARRRGCWDIKTGHGSYYKEWSLQVNGGYAPAYELMFGDKIEETGIIKLNKDTLKCNAKVYKRDERDRDEMAWKHLVKFYWLFNDLKSQFKIIESAGDIEKFKQELIDIERKERVEDE